MQNWCCVLPALSVSKTCSGSARPDSSSRLASPGLHASAACRIAQAQPGAGVRGAGRAAGRAGCLPAAGGPGAAPGRHPRRQAQGTP